MLIITGFVVCRPHTQCTYIQHSLHTERMSMCGLYMSALCIGTMDGCVYDQILPETTMLHYYIVLLMGSLARCSGSIITYFFLCMSVVWAPTLHHSAPF